MATISDVRSELQLAEAEIGDVDVQYALDAAGNDLNLACAKLLEMILAKNRGKRKVRIGSYSYDFSASDLIKLIRRYRSKASTYTPDDGVDHPDSIFTRDGI